MLAQMQLTLQDRRARRYRLFLVDLLQQGFNFAKPRIDAFLRISIGTDAECQQLVAALTEILQA